MLVSRLMPLSVVFLIALVGQPTFLTTTVTAAPNSQIEQPTHRQIDSIRPTMGGKEVNIKTFAMGADGHLYAAVSVSGQSFQQLIPSMGNPGAILKLDSNGKTIDAYELAFTPTAVAVSPSGRLFVGGDGRILELDESGKVLAEMPSPHIPDEKELKEKTIEMVLDMRKRMAGSLGPQIKSMKRMIEDLEKTKEDDRTRLQSAQLKAFQEQLEMLEEMSGDSDDGDDDKVSEKQLKPYLDRVKAITSIAVSDDDVFIVATPPGDYSYDVYRISQDLKPKSAKKILNGLRGCCGQMDIACCPEGLVVSENTKFRVAMYDRDGKAVGHFGKQDRTSREGFGSCCNPMNALPMSDGTILTAESSIGHIKRFNTDGKLVAYIGKASIGGGCKHCELGYDAKSDRYFMMNQNENSICVLASNQTPMSASEKALIARGEEFLKRAAGTWTHQAKELKGGSVKSDAGVVGAISIPGNDNLPITKLQINENGTGKILGGMYKAYGEMSGIEVVSGNQGSASGDANRFNVAISIDGARYIEGIWEFSDESNCEFNTGPMGTVTLTRLPRDKDLLASKSDQATCDPASCDKEGCDCKADAGTKVALIASSTESKSKVADANEVVETEVEYGMMDLSDLGDMGMSYDDMIMPRVTYSYKFIDVDDLGRRAEKRFNKLGKEGWEYCGKIKDDLVFKRAGSFSVMDDEADLSETAEARR